MTKQAALADAAVRDREQRTVARKFYMAAWRWHFYAGLYVVPFLLMLAVTGLMMMYFNVIETRFGDRLLASDGQHQSLTAQAKAAANSLPDGSVRQYIAPLEDNLATMFLVDSGEKQHVVTVDPVTTDIRKTIIKDDSWFYWASDIHGELLIGDLGDRLIEIAAGLGIVLIVTGLYMWWPRNGKGLGSVLWPDLSTTRRTFLKELHVTSGFYISVVLFFFLISGLAWAGIWGGQFVQAWSTFPAEKWDNVPLSEDIHADMNHGVLHDAPWGLEQTPMPVSGSDVGANGIPANTDINLDTMNAFAHSIGFSGQYRINLPRGENGVYTLSADSMSGDSVPPTGDRTIHVDQYSGKVLAEVTYDDYSLAAKSMAVGIALHQGDLGWWNIIANTLFCLIVIFLCVSGIVMWWMRRPANSAGLRLTPPPLPNNLPLWKGAVFLMLVLSLAFPLTGITLVTVLALDILILSRVPSLQRAFG
ncbi:membrane protein [Thalassospira sp. HJ]|uniref:PepSY-associated TM helix domain-containing protein n=1 Tax=Thalassospira sp. HJ TaxID=1616823 RepID=UPI0005CE627C|nr:PepSY domain-containing protein [Thalassospira sp. HJ]KJE36121.1 membrane protein [Thalassospira sp. HJ]